MQSTLCCYRTPSINVKQRQTRQGVKSRRCLRGLFRFLVEQIPFIAACVTLGSREFPSQTGTAVWNGGHSAARSPAGRPSLRHNSVGVIVSFMATSSKTVMYPPVCPPGVQVSKDEPVLNSNRQGHRDGEFKRVLRFEDSEHSTLISEEVSPRFRCGSTETVFC